MPLTTLATSSERLLAGPTAAARLLRGAALGWISISSFLDDLAAALAAALATAFGAGAGMTAAAGTVVARLRFVFGGSAGEVASRKVVFSPGMRVLRGAGRF